MRLINVQTKQMRTFYGNDIPEYAILSHTWLRDNEEITYQRYHLDDDWQRLRGGRKIVYLCQQAAKDRCRWAWIDTCCIDKTNNAELSEAINSMFCWYQDAKLCYVYLADIGSNEHKIFYTSRWWDRAWTLQELLAAKTVIFYDKDWRNIGSKADLAKVIALRRKIDKDILCDPSMIQFRSVAQRMSWAAHRQATRREDLAYSLLGLFGINMNMMYGEGEKAFVRLQMEIMRSSRDMSLFAWNFSPEYLDNVLAKTEASGRSIDEYGRVRDESPSVADISRNGLFAPAPSCFSMCGDMEFLQEYTEDVGVSEQQGIFKLTGPLASVEMQKPQKPRIWDRLTLSKRPSFDPDNEQSTTVFRVAVLPCLVPTEPHALVGMCLYDWHSGNPAAPGTARTIRKGFTGSTYTCFVRKKDVSGLQFTDAKIDPSSEAMLLSNTMLQKVAQQPVLRTFRIQFDGPRHGVAAPCFEVMTVGGKDHWNGTLSHKNIDWDYMRKSANTFHLEVDDFKTKSAWIVKLAHANAMQALYIWLRLSAQLEGDTDLLAMTVCKPMGNISDFQWPDLEEALNSVHDCKQALEDGTFASISTTFVFNHAISTLTIGLKEEVIGAVGPTSVGPTWWRYGSFHTETGMDDSTWDIPDWGDYSYTTQEAPDAAEGSTLVPKERASLPSKRDYSSFTDSSGAAPDTLLDQSHWIFEPNETIPTFFSKS